MATWDIQNEFRTFFLTIMFCLYSASKNLKIIQTCMFSEIVRPKMGLIDPSPLLNVAVTSSTMPALLMFGSAAIDLHCSVYLYLHPNC